MQLKVIPVNTPNKLAATQQEGKVTHMIYEEGGNITYHFQPRGINPKNGHPLHGSWVPAAQLVDQTTVDFDLPDDVLGEIVEDTASGLTGRATQFTIHPNGCLHCAIQPTEVIAETGELPGQKDFDFRQLKGAGIKELSAEEMKKSIKKDPGGPGPERPVRPSM